MRIVVLTFGLCAFVLGGCAEHLPNSVKGSCEVFERPPYAVRGKTQYDQAVADKFVESGVAACEWPRPAARPAQLDAAPKAVKATPAPVKKKRRGFIKRVKEKIWPSQEQPADALTPSDVSTPATAAETDHPQPEPTAAPPPPPRSALDRLLHPNDL
jgi:hypothetical protein